MSKEGDLINAISGKDSTVFEELIKQIRIQDKDFNVKISNFNSIFEDSFIIENSSEMMKRILEFENFKKDLLKLKSNFELSFDFTLKKI